MAFIHVLFFLARHDNVLPAPRLSNRQRQHLSGWGHDMIRRAGLRGLASKPNVRGVEELSPLKAKPFTQFTVSTPILRSPTGCGDASSPLHPDV